MEISDRIYQVIKLPGMCLSLTIFINHGSTAQQSRGSRFIVILLSFSCVDLGTGLFFFFFSLRVMWFKPVHYLLSLMTVVSFFCLRLCNSLPCNCHCQCFSLHGANLGDRSTWHWRLRAFPFRGMQRSLESSRTRETDSNISFQILLFSRLLRFIFFFFLFTIFGI